VVRKLGQYGAIGARRAVGGSGIGKLVRAEEIREPGQGCPGREVGGGVDAVGGAPLALKGCAKVQVAEPFQRERCKPGKNVLLCNMPNNR
jgi:hypothetical protein